MTEPAKRSRPRSLTPLSAVVIEPARSAEAYASARQLFKDYAAWLGVDLSFQGFEHELSSLPGNYSPPRGELLVAWCAAQPAPTIDAQAAATRTTGETTQRAVGCVAVRPLDAVGPNCCEMKRLWVAPELRGSGLGVTLGERILGIAAERGHTRMYLDTLSTMHAANALYRKLGFREVAAYYSNPEPSAVYYAVEL